MATLSSYNDSKFESCQLYGHEEGLLGLYELMQPVVTLPCEYTTVCRTLTFTGIVRAT